MKKDKKSTQGAKIKKGIVKKIKDVPKKKVATKVAVKKNSKKTKTAIVLKKIIKKPKAIAAQKVLKHEALISESSAKMKRKVIYRTKRLVYMIMAVALGILSAGFVLGVIEKVYLQNSFRMGVNPVTHHFLGMQLFLLPIVYVLIFFSGLCFGTWLGFWGWRIVYIEHNHRIFRKK